MSCLDELMRVLNEVADLVAEAALVETGHHQDKRGEWRRLRARSSELG